MGCSPEQVPDETPARHRKPQALLVDDTPNESTLTRSGSADIGSVDFAFGSVKRFGVRRNASKEIRRSPQAARKRKSSFGPEECGESPSSLTAPQGRVS